MLIPESNEYILKLYKCPKCDKYYDEQIGRMRFRCTVIHRPGSCCHEGEKEYSQDQVRAIQETINIRRPFCEFEFYGFMKEYQKGTKQNKEGH